MKTASKFSLSLLIVLVLFACSEAPARMPHQATTTVYNLMVWALEPASDVIWDSAGYIITVDGEQDLQPTTDAGWQRVRNSATVVAEMGNVLMLEGYRVDDEDWIAYSQGLIRTGLKARDAAMAEDAQALFDAGGEIYNVCRACHNRYIVASADET